LKLYCYELLDLVNLVRDRRRIIETGYVIDPGSALGSHLDELGVMGFGLLELASEDIPET